MQEKSNRYVETAVTKSRAGEKPEHDLGAYEALQFMKLDLMEEVIFSLKEEETQEPKRY